MYTIYSFTSYFIHFNCSNRLRVKLYKMLPKLFRDIFDMRSVTTGSNECRRYDLLFFENTLIFEKQ